MNRNKRLLTSSFLFWGLTLWISSSSSSVVIIASASTATTTTTTTTNTTTHTTTTTRSATTRGNRRGPCQATATANNNVCDKQTIVGWKFAGPTTYVSQFGDKDRPKLTSAGAVQTVVQARNGDWWIGSVNGGVWRTSSLRLQPPSLSDTTIVNSNNHHDNNNVPVNWEPVLDGQDLVTCTSISALYASGSSGRIYAGCGGSTSSEQGSDWNVVNSGDWGGVMVSNDGGTEWHMVPGFPVNYYVTDIVEFSAGNTNTTVLLVAAQSHLYDANNGGIWRSTDLGHSFDRVDTTPTFTLTRVPLPSHHHKDDNNHWSILATHARNATHSVSISHNFGESFHNVGPLPWHPGYQPFYTCATVTRDGRIIVGGLTQFQSDNTHTNSQPIKTNSQLFVGHIMDHNHPSDNNDTTISIRWKPIPNQPMSLDQDAMPKDRMALLADPHDPHLLYVAGNAEALAYRVNLTTMTWTKLWDAPDVTDGSVPHADCRNFAFDHDTNHLLVVTDGGIFARTQPQSPGGTWLSLNGNYASLELLSAHYDAKDQRFVMGAQDNCAIVTKVHATPHDTAYGFVEGDGTITLVDSSAALPHSRLFGTTQFLGVGTIDRDPNPKRRNRKQTTTPTTRARDDDNTNDDDDDDDDDNCGGLCFVQGDKFIQVPLTKYFPEPTNFPFFVHPYTLNRHDPTLLQFWVNGTRTTDNNNNNISNSNNNHLAGAIYQFSIPYSVQDKDDIGPPTKVLDTPPGAMILDFVSGGYTAGQPDPDLLVAISSTHLYIRRNYFLDTIHGVKTKSNTSNTMTAMTARPLPMTFAAPVTLDYNMTNNQRILGPLTHARTVFMKVLPSDSRVIAITGWARIDSNLGDEAIFLTMDAGRTWTNITGNLREASGVSGKVRPGGLEFVELKKKKRKNTHALLVGTSSGVLMTVIDLRTTKAPSNATPNLDERQQWVRVGSCSEFPIVLTADIDYEPTSNRLVVATFGRGIYVLDAAKEQLQAHWECLSTSATATSTSMQEGVGLEGILSDA